jgi:hypothetical protein
VIKQRMLAAALLLAACSGGGTTASGPVSPAATSGRGTVEAFMQAVADSNLTRMAQLWGTAAGPASKTNQPPDWDRRVSIMQSYLRNESHRLLPSTNDPQGSTEDVQVEIRRELCTWVVPFTTIRLSDNTWLVNTVDLTKAGNPARPCAPGAGPDSTAAPQ